MKPLKLFSLTALFILFVLSLLASHYYYRLKKKSSSHSSVAIKDAEKIKLDEYGAMTENYVSGKEYNSDVVFLVDMKIASGKNRFFIYDIQNKSVLAASLVTHGRCNNTWLNGRQYSNVLGSGCTSLGKYKIGKPYYGRFGLAYKLHGLESTNSNAFNRYVVLHAHECVPEKELDPYPLCQSDGCPTVSPGFLKKLQKIIDQSGKPVLLWIFE